MFRITKKFTFEASHQLPFHDGKCRRLHGHSWVGYVILEREELIDDGPKTGMLMDFGDIQEVLKPFIEEYLDHRHLNDSTSLANPTSECLASWVFKKLALMIPYLVAVRIEETCTSTAEYWG